MPLLVHGEVTDPEVDIFDREAVFIDRVLAPLRRELPGPAHGAGARHDGGGGGVRRAGGERLAGDDHRRIT